MHSICHYIQFGLTLRCFGWTRWWDNSGLCSGFREALVYQKSGQDSSSMGRPSPANHRARPGLSLANHRPVIMWSGRKGYRHRPSDSELLQVWNSPMSPGRPILGAPERREKSQVDRFQPKDLEHKISTCRLWPPESWNKTESWEVVRLRKNKKQRARRISPGILLRHSRVIVALLC